MDSVAILDCGSYLSKVGMSHHELPIATFKTQVGVPRRRHRRKCDRDFYVGQEVDSNLENLTVGFPVENGIIENFQSAEMLFDFIFVDILQVKPEEHPVLLTETPFTPRPNRERAVELLFEAFGIPALCISIQGILSLLGQGRMTGLILDSGAGSTHVIPIYDGFALPHNIKKLNLAGLELDVYLAKLLARGHGRGGVEAISLTTSSQRSEVVRMKEKCCYVASNPNTEVVTDPFLYQLPDGTPVALYDEAWKVPEALFNPAAVGLSDNGPSGIPGLMLDCVQSCEVDLRKTLFNNILLSGGCTMFPGFEKRLQTELAMLSATQMPARVRNLILAMLSATQMAARVMTSSTDRRHSVWIGAQVFANLRDMQSELWMSSADYDDCGPSYIHEKIHVRYT